MKKGAIFRSTDGGASFEETVLFDPGLGVIPFAARIPLGSVTDLVADPHNASRLYAAVRGAGVFRTDDAGKSPWVQINTGLDLTSDSFDNDGNGTPNDTGETATGAQRIRLAVQQDSTSDSNAVFAALVSNRGGLMGVFRSTDRGAGWSLLPAQGAPPSPTAALRHPTIGKDTAVAAELEFTGGNTITRTEGSWIRDGFVADQFVTVTGSKAAPTNNGTYKVLSVRAASLTIVETTLTNEDPANTFTVTAGPELNFLDTNADTITRSVGSWIADGFMPGQTIKIAGSARNDGSYEITGVTATTLILGRRSARRPTTRRRQSPCG